MSIKDTILSILKILSSIDVTNQDNEVVKLYAKIWNNQTEQNKAKEYIYPLPAVFVELQTEGIEPIGAGVYAIQSNLKLHIQHENYNAEGDFEQDLLIFDLVDKIKLALSETKIQGLNSLILLHEHQDFNHNNIYKYTLEYKTNIIDSAGSIYDNNSNVITEILPQPADLNINVIIDDGDEGVGLVEYDIITEDGNLIISTENNIEIINENNNGVIELEENDIITEDGQLIISTENNIKIINENQN